MIRSSEADLQVFTFTLFLLPLPFQFLCPIELKKKKLGKTAARSGEFIVLRLTPALILEAKKSWAGEGALGQGRKCLPKTSIKGTEAMPKC